MPCSVRSGLQQALLDDNRHVKGFREITGFVDDGQSEYCRAGRESGGIPGAKGAVDYGTAAKITDHMELIRIGPKTIFELEELEPVDAGSAYDVDAATDGLSGDRR